MMHDGSHVARSAVAVNRAAPFAIAGAVAAAALVRYLAPSRTSQASAATKHASLVAYLRDHLSGADAGIHVVRRLAHRHRDLQDGPLFAQLADEFEQERRVVATLLARLGASTQSAKRLASRASAAVLGVAAGGRPGDLALLQTLEALAIGIQGKRCLWRALHMIETPRSAADIDAVALEAQAVRQWDAVDTRRRRLAADTFPMLGSTARSRTD